MADDRFAEAGRAVLARAANLEPLTAELARRSRRRTRVPLWILPVLVLLPVLGVLYAQSLSQPPAAGPSPAALGRQVYAQHCSGCHTPSGAGSAGRQLNDGEVLRTFPDIVDQLEWVKLGSNGYAETYGDPDREGGARRPGSMDTGARMAGFADKLSDEEVLAVVRHEREVLSGEAGVEVDAAGDRRWPDGAPMLDADRRLVWPDGSPMFGDDDRLRRPGR